MHVPGQLLQVGVVVQTGGLAASVHTHGEEDGLVVGLDSPVHQSYEHHAVYEPAGLPIVEHVQACVSDALQQVARHVGVEQVAAVGHIDVDEGVEMSLCPLHGSFTLEEDGLRGRCNVIVATGGENAGAGYCQGGGQQP